MKAVMYGGGNIGRGFIGLLFSQSGYETTFIDIAEPVVNALNERHSYPVRVTMPDSVTDILVENVSAINGNDCEAAAEAIASCDIMATSVGAKILKFIVPNIVKGIRLRFERTDAPLNIIICENLNNANKALEDMLKAELSEEECARFDRQIGLVEASVGRMVPVQTEEMHDGDPLRVCVERYGFLPVDKDAFKGTIPGIKNMLPYSPFDYFVKRKLFIHNMGHACCAYLGRLKGFEYIYEAISDPDIALITRSAMEAAAEALSKKYGMPLADILAHIRDLNYRFTNVLLHDTCDRVGREPERKLAADDRLIGAYRLCRETGTDTSFISVAIAAALFRYLDEAGAEPTAANAADALKKLSGESIPDALLYFGMLCENKSLHEIYALAQQREIVAAGSII